MKPRNFILLLCLMAYSFTGAQPRREMSHVTPRITNAYPFAVKMYSANIWTVNDGAKLNVTFNGGGLWMTVRPLPNFRSIYDYHCVTNGEYLPLVYAATDTGIYYTTDMGENWNQTPVMGQRIISIFPTGDRLYFVSQPYNASDGYVKWFGYLSQPNGSSYSELPAGYSFQLLQVSTNIVYLFLKKGSSVDLLRSTTSGSSWTTISGITNPVSFPLISGFAYGKNVFLVLGFAGRERTTVIHSADTGRTFQVYAPLASDTLLSYTVFSQERGEGIIFGSDYQHMQLARYNITTNAMEFEERTHSSSIIYGDRYEQTGLFLGVNSDIYKADLPVNPLPLTDLNVFLSHRLSGVKVLPSGRPFFLQHDGAIGTYDNSGNYTSSASPYPATQARSFAIPDDSTYYVIGTNQYFYRSTDRGTTFSASRIAGAQDLQAIHFFNSLEGFVADAAGTIWRTTTGGDRWVAAPSPGAGIWGFYFFSYEVGYAMGSSLYRTTNHGQTWQVVATAGNPTYDGFFSVAFDKVGWYGLAVTRYEVFKTTNYGDTWVKINNLSGYFSKCFIKDANNFEIVGGNSGTLHYATTNGGTAWATRRLTSSTLEYVDGNSPENLWGAYLYSVVKSDNNYSTAGFSSAKGATGDTVTVMVYSDLNRYKKFNSLQFVLSIDTSAVSFLGFDTDAAYKTAGWSMVHNFTQPTKLSVAAYGSDSITGFGNILGLKFRVKPSNTPFIYLKYDSFTYNSGADPTYLYDNIIVKDTTLYGDADLNGIVQAYDAATVLRRVAGILPEFGRKAYRQADVTQDNTLSALDAAGIARYVVGLLPRLPVPPAAAAGSIRITPFISQAGTKITVPVRVAEGKNILSFEGALRYNPAVLTLEAVTWGGQFSQFLKEGKMEGGLYRFACAGTQPVAAGTADMLTLTFTIKNAVLDANTTVTLEGFRLNENPMLTQGNSATVALPTGTENGNQKPFTFALHSNYPNPFNPSTVISYEVAAPAQVTITVFDVLGNEVAVLVNERKEAGTYQAVFDAARNGKQLQAGVYFTRMSAGAFTQTNKMLLLK